MKQWWIICCLCLWASSALASGELQVGQSFPGLMLSCPAEQVAAEYLGVADGSKEFDIGAIKAELVVVEFFSMYCPHCQNEAPLVNDVYRRIKEQGLDSKVKMIGIGIGNSSYEVAIFAKKFQVHFPLFPDEDYLWHGEVGKVGTPYFVMIRLDKGEPKVVFTHLGQMESAAMFLKKVKQYL